MLIGVMIAVMAFALREVFGGGDLRSLRLLDVSGRILLRLSQTFGAAEIDRAPEELAFDVFVVNLLAGYRTGHDAVAFAQEFTLDGLRRLGLCLVVSLLVVFAVRERLQRQRRGDDQCEWSGGQFHNPPPLGCSHPK